MGRSTSSSFAAQKRYRVLVVDDDAVAADSVEGVLSGDFEVVTTTSPARALRLVEAGAFHVVCSDYQMPDMDGLELLRRVSQLPEYVGCLLITGAGEHLHTDDHSRHYVVLKPFAPERLIGIVNQLARVAEMKRSVKALAVAGPGSRR